EGQLGKSLHRVPACVRGEVRIDVRGNEPEVGGRELPLAWHPARLAERRKLLEVGEVADVDLGREVPPDRLLQGLAALEVAAGKGPASCERRLCPAPQQHV